jgi:superfamily I DNA/RNA helicase
MENKQLKDFKKIESEYNSCVENINNSTDRKYKIIIVTVKYISYKNKETTAKIYILHDSEKKKLEMERKYASEKLTLLVKKYIDNYGETIRYIDKQIIAPLWKQYNNIFVKPFASIDYGNSKTCHKSQGSTYYNVFVDMNDIVLNKDENDMKRCVYVACTRASNELHILLPKK